MDKNYLQFSSRRILLPSVFAAALAGLTLPASAVTGAAQAIQAEQTQGEVKGKVVDSAGEPVIGATVKIDGVGKVGAITDIDGNFVLNNVAKGGTLEISSIGFTTQKVSFRPGQSLIVTMKDDSKTLDDVVVVGFGTQKKVNLTGAVSVVTSKEIAQRPVQSAASALQGLIPGLQISSSSGRLDSNPSINVRGTATIGEGTSGSPLVLIDGAEGDINTLNSQDIESVSVLKDAAASSIYGSRAPFGVILITTKKGKQGKVSINYNNSFRFSGMIRGKHTMNSVDFASWLNDMMVNNGGAEYIGKKWMDGIVAYHNATPVGPGTRRTADGTLVYGIMPNGNIWGSPYDPVKNDPTNGYGFDDVDWYDALYKSSTFAMEHNASVSGANDNVNYYASFNYLDNNGFLKLNDDNYKRYNSTAKLGINITKWLSMNYNMRFVRTDYVRPSRWDSNVYNDLARQGWPIVPLYDRNGYMFDAPSPGLQIAQGGKDTTQRDILTQQVNFTIEPIKNWKTHVDFTYKTDNVNNHWDTHTTYNHDVNGNPYVNTANSGRINSEVHESDKKENYFNFQAYTEYGFNIAKKHDFHVMAGFQAEQLKQFYFDATRNGLIDDTRPELNLTTGLGQNGNLIDPSISGYRNQWQTAGFFGRLNYNYDERYLLEVNVRHDGTSRFRRNQMWRTFPSVSLGWNIANEKFFQSAAKTVNLLKFRASYGSLGNQNTDDWYRTYQTITYNPTSGTWLQNGLKPSTVAAPGLVSALLTWEKIESYDLGLDFGLLNNRLTGSFDWYIRNTKDMVGNAPELPSVLGTSVPVTNNTDLRTSGWELQISWRDALSNGLNYGATFNLSDSRTKITRYPNNPTKSISTYIEGRYINEIFGYETVGIAKSDKEMQDHLAKVDQSTIGDKWGAGDIMYKDLNGDGKISSGDGTINDLGDKKLIGNSTPRFLMGLDLNASWKGFDVRAFFQGVLKRDYWTGSTFLFGADGGGMWWAAGITAVQDYYRDENSWSVKNGYQQANTDAWLPRVLPSAKNEQCQTRYLLNAAYVRLKNLQVGYTIPRAVTSKWNISNLRIFFSAENLLTITSMPDQFDPELIGHENNNGYPLSRTLSFGLNVSF